ncbi:S4 domain-containing protein [Henriciella pelagia]|uniref:S4 domain-containing protein n=1 Tax=Henriciella pelagia TaxID=1977912 RepID=UPI001E4863C9|nr:S4 domain-containing protein [Henriciella pelagia]
MVISEDIRLDVWLWRARFFKTRAISADFVSKRGVRISRGLETRKVNKPGMRVVAGDVVSFALRTNIVTVRVLQAGTRRGPAAEAQTLYETLVQESGGNQDA